MKKIIEKYLVDKYKIECDQDILTLRVEKHSLIDVKNVLKNNQDLLFNQLTDICGIDYSLFGKPEWNTKEVTSSGYSRGIKESSHGRIKFGDSLDSFDTKDRFCVCYHLLSLQYNHRISHRD